MEGEYLEFLKLRALLTQIISTLRYHQRITEIPGSITATKKTMAFTYHCHPLSRYFPSHEPTVQRKHLALITRRISYQREVWHDPTRR